MQYPIEFLKKPAQPVLSIRTRCSMENLPKTLGEVYGKVMQYIGEAGAKPVDAPFVAYFNMDMQDLDIEAGIPVLEPVSGRGEVQQSEIPAGKQVTCLYTGPYAECGPAYEAVQKWIADNGHEAVGTVYEFYLNDPNEVPESQLQTRIMFLLK